MHIVIPSLLSASPPDCMCHQGLCPFELLVSPMLSIVLEGGWKEAENRAFIVAEWDEGARKRGDLDMFLGSEKELA